MQDCKHEKIRMHSKATHNSRPPLHNKCQMPELKQLKFKRCMLVMCAFKIT